MISSLLGKINGASLDLVDNVANKLGFGSIITSVGLTVSHKASATEVAQTIINAPWVFTDYALLISVIGGVLFIIEKLIVIYIRVREASKLDKIERQKKKSRNLPK